MVAMSSSSYGYRVLYTETDYPAESFLHTDLGRMMANNAQHYYDTCGQCRWKWRSHDPTSNYLTHDTIASADVDLWQLIAVLGPVPLTIDKDGAPFKLRCSLAGHRSGSATCKLRGAVTPAHRIERMGADSSTTNGHTFEATVTTTDAWVVDSTMLTLDALDAWAMTTNVDTDDASGNPVAVNVAMSYLSLWGQTDTAATSIRCTGYEVSEYVGT